jgi:serine/threonine protein kinase
MTVERLRASLANRYRLERELGQGGMATVYLAQDLRHDRQVAIKVLKPELAAVLGTERGIPTSSRCSIPAPPTASCTTSCPTSKARRSCTRSPELFSATIFEPTQ